MYSRLVAQALSMCVCVSQRPTYIVVKWVFEAKTFEENSLGVAWTWWGCPNLCSFGMSQMSCSISLIHPLVWSSGRTACLCIEHLNVRTHLYRGHCGLCQLITLTLGQKNLASWYDCNPFLPSPSSSSSSFVPNSARGSCSVCSSLQLQR